MAIKLFRGDAQGRAQVTHVTPANVEAGDEFVLTINRKDVKVVASEATIESVVNAFVARLGEGSNIDIPEFAEITATTGRDDSDEVTHLVLTGPANGKPFTVTSATLEGGLGITIEETVAGDPGRNEKQRITLPGSPTGGDFTLEYDGQVTGAIAYNATGATIDTALEALSNIAAGDVAVTGNAGGPWTVEFLQALENTDVSLLIGDGTNLTYGAGAKPVRVQVLQNGSGGVNEIQVVTLIATSGTFTLTFDTETTGAIAYNASAATLQTALEALSNIAPGDVSVSVVGNTSGNQSAWKIEFKGVYKALDVPLFSCNGASLDGGNGVAVDRLQKGAAATTTIIEMKPGIANGSYFLKIKHPLTGVVTTTPAIPQQYTKVHLAGILGQTQGYSQNDFAASDNPSAWAVEFKGSFTGVNVEIVSDIEDEDTENGSIQGYQPGSLPLPLLAVLREGSATALNTKYSVEVYGATGGTFTLNFIPDTGGAIQTTSAIAYNASAATVKAALEALSNVDTCNVTGSDGGPWTVEFTGTHASKPQVLLLGLGGASLTGSPISAYNLQQPVAGQNERQSISIGGNPAGGTFTLSFDGQTSAAIAFDATAADVRSALEALSNIAPGDVEVLSDNEAGGPWVVTFGGAYKWLDVAAITGDGTNLTGGTVEVSTIQVYIAKTNELQTVSIEQAQGGTFTLTYGAGTSETIPYNASASVVEGALERTSTIGVGNVVVNGDAGGPYTVEFTGTLAGTDIALMTASAAGLTGNGSQTFIVSEDIVPTGPEYFDDPENWSTNSLPVDGDTIEFQGDVNCRYGLVNPTIAPARIILKNFTGEIGLLTHNGDYYEYRPRYLALGEAGDTIEVDIGSGDGTGSSLCRFDFGDARVNLRCRATGTASDDDRPALYITGDNAASEIDIYRGSVGIAYEADETSQINKLRIGAIDDTGDAEVFVGFGCSVIPAVQVDAGTVDLNCAITALVTNGGDTSIHGTGAVGSIACRGGNAFYNTTGTLGGNTVVSGEGTLSFARDIRPKTVTNPIEVYGNESSVLDPYKVVGGLIIDYNETTRFGDIGTNFRLTRGAVA